MNFLKSLLIILAIAIITPLHANNTNPPVKDGDEVSVSTFMVSKQKVLILWNAKEEGVYFEIERSSDGENYEMIATSDDVVAASNGTQFQFVDESPAIENYYRIFYITPSGAVDYTDVSFVSPLPSDMTLDGLK